MKKKDMKKLILNYLQLHGLDLRAQISSLNEARFEDDPPRLVLCLSKEEENLPEIKFMGQLLPVETMITGEPVILKHDEEQLPIPKKHSTEKDDIVFHHNIAGTEEAISPFSKPKNVNEETEEAIKKWKSRWPSVKVDEEK